MEPYTVLLVDDVKYNLITNQRALESTGIKVKTAQSVSEGLKELAEAPRPDVIVVDLKSSDADSFKFMETVKPVLSKGGNTISNLLNFVLLTGAAEPNTILRARQVGYQDVLIKPLDIPRLLASMKAFREKSPLPTNQPAAPANSAEETGQAKTVDWEPAIKSVKELIAELVQSQNKTVGTQVRIKLAELVKALDGFLGAK